MKNIIIKIIGGVLLSISPFLLNAQISLVPAQHPVYEWLHKQRILNNVSNYSYETLPLARGRVFELLREIPENEITRIDKKLLATYMLEFSMDSLRAAKSNTLLQGKGSDWKGTVKMKYDLLKSKREPHLYVYEDSSTILNVDYFWGRGYQYSDSGDGISYGFNGLRSYGSLYNTFGFYLEVVNPSGAGGGLKNVDYWGKTFDAFNGKSATIYAEGFASVKYKKLSMHIGNGNIKYGTGNDETLIFRLQAANFDWVRINFDSKLFNYTYIHGALQGDVELTTLSSNPNVQTRTSAPRWITLRRFQLRPFKQLQIAFTETLTYSNRGLDIGYINPIYPLRVAEYNKEDQDNPTWYLDALIKPFKGLELYGTLGIDDLADLGDIFKSTGNRATEDGVLSFQAGIHASPKGMFQLNAEYERIEPFYYTHWLQLNSYVQPFKQGIPLANEIGPNADQWSLSVKKWLPWRGWVKGYFSSVRKGMNVLDENGDLLTDVGGDIMSGQNNRTDVVRFLSGDLHKYNIFGIETSVEPWRGVSIYLDYNKRIVTQGNRIENDDFFALRINLTYYPLNMLINRIPKVHI